jgi:dCMP deaminase
MAESCTTTIPKTRISKEQFLIDTLLLVSERSTCIKYKVGCVIAEEHSGSILATGYNGTPKGFPHCQDLSTSTIKHEYGSAEIHAEINALSKLNPTTADLVLYTTYKPCIDCAKAIIAFNNRYKINKIYYMHNFVDIRYAEFGSSAAKFFHDAGIEIYKINTEEL